ncbi:MAG: chromate transporter [Anaerovoracaceae bacterium]
MKKDTDKSMSKRQTAKILFDLFFSFFKIGLFTIGGGMAMIPLIERLVVKDRQWLSEEEMVDCIAVSQSLPGVVAINTATYIGNSKMKVKGALAATFGVILPSFVIILIMATLLDAVGRNPYLDGAFVGIKAAVCGLITVTAYNMGKKILKGVFPWAVAGVCFVVIAIFRITAIWAILAAAIAGVIYHCLRTGKRGVPR